MRIINDNGNPVAIVDGNGGSFTADEDGFFNVPHEVGASMIRFPGWRQAGPGDPVPEGTTVAEVSVPDGQATSEPEEAPVAPLEPSEGNSGTDENAEPGEGQTGDGEGQGDGSDGEGEGQAPEPAKSEPAAKAPAKKAPAKKAPAKKAAAKKAPAKKAAAKKA